MKIYSCRPTNKLPESMKPRLIRAQNANQALRFATAEFYECALATQDQLVDLATNGIKVETVLGLGDEK